MIGRRAVIGLSLLCALAFSAIAATGAMAESKTTTAFTCVEKAVHTGAGFSKEHCREADAVSVGAAFEHVAIVTSPTEWTKFHATNENTAEETTASTNAVLTATVGGLKAIFTAKKVTVTGELQNFEDPVTKAMDIKQKKVVLHFTEVVLSGALSTTEGCKVVNATVITESLEATSLINTMETEYKPEVGGVFANIHLEGCKTKKLNEVPVEVTGTAKSIGDGATVETTATTTSGLKAAGQTASFTSKVTPRMINAKEELENPIGATTIVDP